jgi:hypothetical protein
MTETNQPHPADRVATAPGHPQVLDRVQRWAAGADPRIVRRLWPAQPAGAPHVSCPACGGPMPDGVLVTLNQSAAGLPADPAPRARAAGAVEALTPGRPIAPGELWCVVCLPCLERRGLAEHLLGLVDQALRGARRRPTGAPPPARADRPPPSEDLRPAPDAGPPSGAPAAADSLRRCGRTERPPRPRAAAARWRVTPATGGVGGGTALGRPS